MKQPLLASLRLVLVLLALPGAAGLAEARDRPSPPTDVFTSATAYNFLTSPPRLLVHFRNGASEDVGFLLEWTRNGAPMNPDLSGLVQCATGGAQEYGCTAMYWFVKGRYGPGYLKDSRGSIQGFFMNNVDFDTDYCFRFMAITDSQVISGSWSGWGCVHTPSLPQAPAAPVDAQVTFLPGNDGRGQLGDAIPPRELVEWRATQDGYVASYTAQIYDQSSKRWTSSAINVPPSQNRYNYEATIDLPPDSVDAQSLRSMRVCAVNIAATRCTNARRPFASLNPSAAAKKGESYAKAAGLRGSQSLTAKADSAAIYAVAAAANATQVVQVAKPANSAARYGAAVATPQASSGSRVSASAPVFANPAVRPSAPAAPAGPPVQIRDAWPHVVYSINPAGELQWSAQASPAAQFSAPQTLAGEWGAFVNIVPGGNGTFYAITADGVLKWYRHDGYLDGSPRLTGPVDVSTGWSAFAKVFGGGDGVLYGIAADGTLLWYRHGDVANAVTPANWSGPTPVGAGWQSFVQVFSMGGGVIYGVTPDGKLLWYRHKGYLTGAKDWEGPKQVGSGWAFKSIMAPGPGRIVAVNAAGDLVQYQHDGYVDGTFRWQGPTVAGAASWLDAARVFPVMQNSLP